MCRAHREEAWVLAFELLNDVIAVKCVFFKLKVEWNDERRRRSATAVSVAFGGYTGILSVHATAGKHKERESRAEHWSRKGLNSLARCFKMAKKTQYAVLCMDRGYGWKGLERKREICQKPMEKKLFWGWTFSFTGSESLTYFAKIFPRKVCWKALLYVKPNK